jgi:hypothetical protein
LASVTLPALDAATLPSVQTTSTGDPDVKSTAVLDLATLPGGVLSGTVNPATLTSVVDANGAASALTSTLANVGALGGVANIDSASANLGGVAAPDSSTANRSVTVNGVTVLDLRALLNLLGLDLNKLPLGTLTGLIGQLNLVGAVNTATNSAFATADQLLTAVTNAETAAGPALAAISPAQSAVDQATAALSAANGALAAASANFAAACAIVNVPLVCDPLQALVNSAQGNVTSARGVLATAKAALATLQATLAGVLATLNNLLNGIGNVLGTAKLLEVEGVQVGAIATAKDTIENSSAIVAGTIGDIKIGGLDLGGIDANAALGEISALAGQVTSQLNAILATISPSLGNLVNIELFNQATDVTQNGDYVKAVARIAGLIATVTPPDLCAVLNDVVAQLPVGGNSLPGVSLPTLPVAGLLTTLGSVVSCSTAGAASMRGAAVVALPALLSPVTLTAAEAGSVAEFRPVVAADTPAAPGSPATPAAPGSPALPRTGMNETLLLVIGGLMAAFALGLRRVSVPAKVQARK